jgi:hypothetical protein
VRAALGRSDPESSAWKREKYLRGELVTKDVSAFLRTSQVRAKRVSASSESVPERSV